MLAWGKGGREGRREREKEEKAPVSENKCIGGKRDAKSEPDARGEGASLLSTLALNKFLPLVPALRDWSRS